MSEQQATIGQLLGMTRSRVNAVNHQAQRVINIWQYAAVELGRRDFRRDEIEMLTARIEANQEVDRQLLISIKDAANKWKGGFIVVVALGAFITWLISVGAEIGKFFK